MSKKRIGEDAIRACHLYTNKNLSMEKIAKLLGFSPPTIKRILIENNVALKPIKRLTEKQKEEIVKLYCNDKLSTWQIAPRFNVLNVCILNTLRKAGIKLRSRSDAAKTYSVNRNYFKIVDTKEKAYILGLLYSDGNVYRDSLTLCFEATDKYILEEISKEIEFTGPLNFRKGGKNTNGTNRRDAWVLRVHDKEFVSTVRRLGIIERKTTKLSFPYWLKDGLWQSFLLGLFDGDGNAYHKGSLRVSIAGASQMTKDIADILYQKLNIICDLQYPKNSNGTVVRTSSTSPSLVFLNWLYENPPKFFFKRKFETYVKTIDHVLKPNSRFKSSVVNIAKESYNIIKLINEKKENCN